MRVRAVCNVLNDDCISGVPAHVRGTKEPDWGLGLFFEHKAQYNTERTCQLLSYVVQANMELKGTVSTSCLELPYFNASHLLHCWNFSSPSLFPSLFSSIPLSHQMWLPVAPGKWLLLMYFWLTAGHVQSLPATKVFTQLQWVGTGNWCSYTQENCCCCGGVMAAPVAPEGWCRWLFLLSELQLQSELCADLWI